MHGQVQQGDSSASTVKLDSPRTSCSRVMPKRAGSRSLGSTRPAPSSCLNTSTVTASRPFMSPNSHRTLSLRPRAAACPITTSPLAFLVPRRPRTTWHCLLASSKDSGASLATGLQAGGPERGLHSSSMSCMRLSRTSGDDAMTEAPWELRRLTSDSALSMDTMMPASLWVIITVHAGRPLRWHMTVRGNTRWLASCGMRTLGPVLVAAFNWPCIMALCPCHGPAMFCIMLLSLVLVQRWLTAHLLLLGLACVRSSSSHEADPSL